MFDTNTRIHFRMTTSYSDVLEFLRENNYPNQDSQYTQPNQPLVPTTRRPVTPSFEARQANQLQMTQACVESMPSRMTHLKRYCTIFWNEKLCCEHCPDIC